MLPRRRSCACKLIKVESLNFVNCTNGCLVFVYGHCKLVYSECAPRRQLTMKAMDDVVTTICHNLLRRGRQLEAKTILATGFVENKLYSDRKAVR